MEVKIGYRFLLGCQRHQTMEISFKLFSVLSSLETIIDQLREKIYICTHTCFLSLSVSLSFSLSHTTFGPHTNTLSLSLTHTHTWTHNLWPTHSLTPTLTLLFLLFYPVCVIYISSSKNEETNQQEVKKMSL